MTTITINEDPNGRQWRARALAAAARRRWPWIVGGVAAFVGSLAFYDVRPLSLGLFLACLPGLANIGILVAYPLVRWIPQKWILTHERITGRGGWESGAVRWSDVTAWSVAPIEVLPGYAWLGWATSRRKRNGMVLGPSAPRTDVEAAFRALASGRELPPMGFIG